MRNPAPPASVVPHRRRERAVVPSVMDDFSSGRVARFVPAKDDPYWDWRPLLGATLAQHRLEWRTKDSFSWEEMQSFFYGPLRKRPVRTGPTGPTGPVGISDDFAACPAAMIRKGECKSPNGRILKDIVVQGGVRSVRGFRPNYLEVRCSVCGFGAYVIPELPIAAGLARAVKDLRGRWGEMSCDEVADHLVVRDVMET